MCSLRRAVPVIPVSFVVFVLLFCIVGSPRAAAQAATTTSTVLTVTPACLAQGCVVTLTAKVTAGSATVHPGHIYFCDGPAASCKGGLAVGDAQITSNGNARLAKTLSPGRHNLYAIFTGTSAYTASTSATHELTIAPPSSFNTMTTFNAISNGAPVPQYVLQSIVTTLSGGPAANGTVAYSTGPGAAPFVSAPLGTNAYRQFQYLPSGLDLSQIPTDVIQGAGPVFQGTGPAATTGDFNNDGFNDIVIPGFSVLLGSANGSFTLAPSGSSNHAGNGPLLIADFNGDGKLDIASADRYGNALRVSLGNGDGTFTDAAPTSVTGPTGIAVGDFNNDGIPDLAVTVPAAGPSGYGIQIALGKGDGTFTPQSTVYLGGKIGSGSALVGDEDKDGKPDLILTESGSSSTTLLQVLHGIGDGTFTPITATTPVPNSDFGFGYLAADFNADGITDIFLASGSKISLWEGIGDGTFGQPANGNPNIATTGPQFAFTVADFNHDGVLDIGAGFGGNIFGAPGPPTTYLIYLGDNSKPNTALFSASTSLNLPSAPQDASFSGYTVVNDFNSDGTLDVVDLIPGMSDDNRVAESVNYVGEFTTSTAAANVTTSNLPAGEGNVLATYSGDGNHTTSSADIYLPNVESGFNLSSFSGSGTNSLTLSLNGGATNSNNAVLLQLTDGGKFEARSAFYPTRVPVYDFQTHFEFQIPDEESDGMAFVVQSNGPNAIGSNGGGLGYGLAPGATTGASIVNSLAVVFDTHNNQGEGGNSVRVETGGITSPAGSIDLTPSGIDLHNGDHFQVEVDHVETAKALTLTLTDMDTGKIFTHTFTVDLFAALGDTAGYVGFTAATGATASIVNVLSWTYSSHRCCDTIDNFGTPYFPAGFTGSSILPYGGAAVINSALQLTSSAQFQATSAYFIGTTASAQWATDFDFTIQGTNGDGFTFFRSNGNYGAVGETGGALGYAGPEFSNSLAVKFDLHNNDGEGANSTGVYYDGAYPSVPAINLYPSRIDLHSGHTFHARISYYHGALNLSITDLNNYAVFTTRFNVGPGFGNSLAGFTAGSGATANTIDILNWTYDQVDVDQ